MRVKKIEKGESPTFLESEKSKNKYDKSQITRFDFVFDDMLQTELRKLDERGEQDEQK